MSETSAAATGSAKDTPGPVLESVWDYPRPPRLEQSRRRVRVIVDGIVIADSTAAIRVLETSHPPAWYVPPADVRMDLLEPTRRRTACEYKGEAAYYRVGGTRAAGDAARAGSPSSAEIAWTYRSPLPGYQAIRDYVAFYPGRVDEAWLDEERVSAQAGDYYGGWITSDIAGPFKGGEGTTGW